MKKKVLSILMWLCLVPGVAGAQDYSGALGTYDYYQNLPATPTAVSLARSINCPVDHRTGVADVKIPLYDLEVNDIKIPIYLTYHGSGVKVRDGFSWVGAGWTLHAEPVIARSVQGVPDEDWLLHCGYMSPYSMTNAERYEFIYTYKRDYMPDRFYYSLPEESGEFMMCKTSSGITTTFMPFTPMKLNLTLEDKIKNFTLTDKNGLVYSFGNGVYGISNYVSGSEEVYSDWKCTSIRSPHTGTEVTFDYQDRTLREVTDNDFLVKETLADASVNSPSTYVKYIIDNREVWKDGYARKVYLSDKDYASAYLPSTELNALFPSQGYGYAVKDQTVWYITCGEYDIEFKTKTIESTQVLDEIIVYHQKLRKIKRIKFYISRMNPSIEGSTYAEHCKLDSLHFCEGGGTAVEKYRMNYYNPTHVPKKTSRDLDHWGYYNAAGNSGSLVARQVSFMTVIDGANRDANEATAYYGVLKDIIYPTGGKTSFEYELHRHHMAGVAPEASSIGGGLRITQITETPLIGNPVIRKFEYGPGLCRYQPIDGISDPDKTYYSFFFRREQKHFYYFDDVLYSKTATNVTYFPAHPLMDPNMIKGTTVEYSKVTEIRSDSTRSTYEYELAPFENYSQYEYPYVDSREQWKYGKLKRKVEYKRDEETGTYKVLRITGNEYDVYNASYNAFFQYDEDTQMHGEWIPELVPEIPYYQVTMRMGINHLTATNDTLYDDTGHYRVTRTEYNYMSQANGNLTDSELIDESALLRLTTVTHPDGTVSTERTWYPGDLSLSDSDGEKARKNLVSNNRLTVPLQLQNSTNGVPVQTVSYSYTLDEDSIAQIASLSLGKDTAGKERIRYSHHTPQGKPMQKTVDGIQHTVYLYSYEGDRLVAEIKNATYEEVETVLGSEFITALTGKIATDSDFDTLEALGTEHPHWHVSLFQHSMGNGVIYMKAPGALPMSYDYDNFKRLSSIYIQEADDKRTLLERFNYHYTNPINY